MNKKLNAATLAMLALLAGGAASAQGGAKPADRPAEMSRTQLVSRLDAQFAQLDTNRDGFISDAERTAVRDARIAERFQRMDADKNGSVTLAEMKARSAQRGHAAAGPRGKQGGYHGMRGGRGGLAGMHRDADKDGRISKAEFQAPALARFDRADADRNGVVTAAERQAARAAMKGVRSR